MYLVDTNVLSELAAPRPRPEIVDWLDRHSADLYLSVITATEVTAGIAKLRREGALAKAARLSDWWATVVHLYAERILPFALGEAQIAGELSDRARSAGAAPGLADIAIAATARTHGLTLLSRNTRHFDVLGVAVVDPFAGLPQ